MPTITRETYRRRGNTTILRKPSFIVKIAKANEKYSHSYSASGTGTVYKNFVPLSIVYRKCPEGSELKLDTNYQALCTTDYHSFIEEFVGADVTVSMKSYVSGRLKTTVVFKGTILDFEMNVNPKANGVVFVASDLCYRLANSPIKMETDGLTLGQVFGMLSAGFKNTSKWNEAAGTFLSTTTFFYPKLWPEDVNGNVMAGIDPALFSLYNRADSVKLTGQPLIAALCALLKQRRDLVPVITYSGNVGLFTGKVRGSNPLDLVIGTVGKSFTSHVVPNDIAEESGSVSFQGVFNRVIVEGGVNKQATTQDLVPAWSTADNAAVLADPLLRDTPRYRHVGRIYYVANPIFPVNSIPMTMCSGDTSEGHKTDDPVISYKKHAEDTTYKKMFDEFKVVQYRRNQNSTYMNAIDNGASEDQSKASKGNVQYIEFKATKMWFDYTLEQEAAINRGEVVGAPEDKGFYQMQIQAVSVLDDGEPLTAESGVVDSLLPFVRTRYYESKNLSPTSGGYVYTFDEEDNAEEYRYLPTLTEDTARTILYLEAHNTATRSAIPNQNKNYTLSYLLWECYIGQGLGSLYNTQLDFLEKLAGIEIEQISQELGEVNRTTLTLSQSVKEITSGYIVGGF